MSCNFKNCPLYYPCLEMLEESPECSTNVQQLKDEILPLIQNAFSSLNNNLPYDALGYMREAMAKLSAD
jgi:hypothetical protein